MNICQTHRSVHLQAVLTHAGRKSNLTPRSAWDHGEPWSSWAVPDPLSTCCPDRWQGPEKSTNNHNIFAVPHCTSNCKEDGDAMKVAPTTMEKKNKWLQVESCHLHLWCQLDTVKFRGHDSTSRHHLHRHTSRQCPPTWLYLPSLTSFCLLRNQSGILYCRGFCMMVTTRSTWEKERNSNYSFMVKLAFTSLWFFKFVKYLFKTI